MEEYKVKDLSLAEKGALSIEWAKRQMPVLSMVQRRLEAERPLESLRIAACLHVTKETAVLIHALEVAGAEVSLCASNPLSTQDAVAAALAKEGIHVYAWRGQSTKDYYECIRDALNWKPQITIDDGADLVTTIHVEQRNLIQGIIGGTEETTTGVMRLRAMEREGALGYPIIAVNDARSKNLFDNPIGTGQSTLDGIMRATNVLIAGKNVVVVGFGQVESGIA
ncbi:MAG: adenosylhomocysteinase, partial [Candidatus Bathyarchaeia archaeon]